jgi:hypothetical protein
MTIHRIRLDSHQSCATGDHFRSRAVQAISATLGRKNELEEYRCMPMKLVAPQESSMLTNVNDLETCPSSRRAFDAARTPGSRCPGVLKPSTGTFSRREAEIEQSRRWRNKAVWRLKAGLKASFRWLQAFSNPINDPPLSVGMSKRFHAVFRQRRKSWSALIANGSFTSTPAFESFATNNRSRQ